MKLKPLLTEDLGETAWEIRTGTQPHTLCVASFAEGYGLTIFREFPRTQEGFEEASRLAEGLNSTGLDL